ncbi:MAG: endo-1,4-beta-xylanase [Treponema sp.]|nr:endo-1,4-beta-xylanase [Treponema sp.]
MKKHILSALLCIIYLALPPAAPAQRPPESIRDSTPSLKECYAGYFTIGASSYADGEEENRIKEQKKESRKEKKQEKKKAKAQKKKGRNSSTGDEDDDQEDEKPEPVEKSSFFVRTAGKHFTELSSGTELLPARLLGKKPKKFTRFTASDGLSYEVPAKWDSQYLSLFLDDAKRAGVQVRFHLLICPEMSPDWFFFRYYDTASRLAGKDEMAARLEWYIKTVTDFISDWEQEHNQGQALVTSYDVLSELFTDSGDLNLTPYNYLMKIFGDSSYAIQAFAFASQCVPASVKLCYSDHSLFEKKKADKVKELIISVRAADGSSRVDEIGIISHLMEDWPDREAFFGTCRDFSSMGLDVQIQQLDMAARKRKDCGDAYFDFMRACMKNSAYIKGVSFRAVNASEETDFVDYMRSPLFTSEYSCTKNFDRIIEAAGHDTGSEK